MRITLLRLLLLILLAFSFSVKAQLNQKPILFEWNILKIDSTLNLYISFRISNDNLIFIKDKEFYKSGLSITYDIFDSNDKLINRITDKEEVTLREYSLTNSRDSYLEGISNLKIESGKYKVVPTVNLIYAEKDYVLKEFFVEIPSLEKLNLSKPIVINSNLVDCKEDAGFYALANYEGMLPFSPESFSLIIPIQDYDSSIVSVKVNQNKKNILTKSFYEIKYGNIDIDKCSDKIVIVNNYSNENGFIILENLNNIVDEGDFTVSINYGKHDHEFSLTSVWIKKPRNLRVIKEAVLILYNFFDEKAVDEVFRADSDSLYSALKNFWKKYDGSSNKTFNKVMSEFYSRVDFAIDNYSSINKMDGAKSDRGKVYIKYGIPSKSNRVFSNNKVLEIWEYADIDKKFVFADNSGTGNFVLEK